MCNFYIMYYVDGPKIMSEEYCFSAGPPHWYWSNMKTIRVDNAPNDASIVPGSDKIWKVRMLLSTTVQVIIYMYGSLYSLAGGSILAQRYF